MSGTVFLVNPASAAGATGKRWPELAQRAAALGLVGDSLLSSRPGHLVELAREAVENGADRLVAVGGDGTVHEVVNGLAGSDVDLALIPRGTGTDFARTFHIPTKFDDAVHVVLHGRPLAVDLGRASFRSWSGETRDAYFANIASAGMSGAIAKRANETTKAVGGKVSYLWATLAVFSRWRSTEISVRAGDFERRARMHDVVVANGRYLGGGMMICPDARPDDGLLDVLLIGDLTKRDLMLTLPKTYRGRHLPHPKAELLRVESLEVDAPEPLPVQLDGEQPGTTPVRFAAARAALRLTVPASSSP